MVKSEEEIKKNIEECIKEFFGRYSSWYIGVSQDPETRLCEHKVRRTDACLRQEASSGDVARRVEKHFLKLGCQGGTGGGDEDAKFVYVFKKQRYTDPPSE